MLDYTSLLACVGLVSILVAVLSAVAIVIILEDC